MAKAITSLDSGRVIGFGQLNGNADGAVHDGDTVTVDPLGYLPVRFLGVDAPEVSCELHGFKGQFLALTDKRWIAYLDDPFASTLPEFELADGLREYLELRVGPDCAENQAGLATKSRDALEAEVRKDIAELGQDEATFSFFLSFASQVMDGYGRLLCFLNRNQKGGDRPLTYNERLLGAGWVVPYFIWPNLDPFRKQPYITEAVPKPGAAAPTEALKRARDSARQAREDREGVWQVGNPLRLQPFELRFFGRRKAPDRWVIDLGADDDLLLGPQLYHRIPNPEDRLFVPAEYVPLFVSEGWKETPA